MHKSLCALESWLKKTGAHSRFGGSWKHLCAFTVSNAFKDGSTKEMSSCVAQRASFKLPGNPLEPGDVEDDPEATEDSD